MSVCTFSKIVKSDSDHRDEAVVGGKKINKDEKYKKSGEIAPGRVRILSNSFFP